MAPMPAPDRPPVAGFAIVITAASLFGMLGPLSRFAYDAGMEPLPFVAWRGGIGLLAAGAFVAWRISRGAERLTRLADLDREARLTLLVAALLGFSLNLAMFIAFDLVTVALALLGFYTYPVIVAGVNVALGREPLDRSRAVALVLAVGGMVAVVASQLDPAAGIRVDAIGFGLALAAALSQAAFVVISRTGYRTVPASQAMTVVLATTVICSVAIGLVTGAGTALTYPLRDPSILPLLAFTGLFAAAIPSILFLTGIRRDRRDAGRDPHAVRARRRGRPGRPAARRAADAHPGRRRPGGPRRGAHPATVRDAGRADRDRTGHRGGRSRGSAATATITTGAGSASAAARPTGAGGGR